MDPNKSSQKSDTLEERYLAVHKKTSKLTVSYCSTLMALFQLLYFILFFFSPLPSVTLTAVQIAPQEQSSH